MANQGIIFDGRRIIHPGAYDKIDTSAMVQVDTGSVNIPVVIGEASAGKQGELVWVNDITTAREYLVGGELLTAVKLMFSPIPEGGGGASRIGVMVSNATTQATLSKGGLTISAVQYGVEGNKIQCKLENGTIAGSKKFTAYKWDTNQLEIIDNLGVVLRILYTGDSAYASASVLADLDGVTPKTLQTRIGADEPTAVVDLSIDLLNSRFNTIEALGKYINSLSDYAAYFVNYENYELPTSKLDIVASTDIKATTSPEGVVTGGGYIKATKGDIEYVISKVSRLVDVEVTDVPTNFAYDYMAGGGAGVSPSSWATLLEKLEGVYTDILVLLTDDNSIHAEGLLHVNQMELRNQKQVLFVGGGESETVSQAIQRATVLNSSRAVLAYPGIYYLLEDSTKPLPAYFTAAMIAGRVCGVAPTEPITFDHFANIALVNDLLVSNPEVEELISSGVATLERVINGGIRLVQGRTTYLGPNSLLQEISGRRGADVISGKLRTTLENRFVGKRGVKTTTTSVETVVIDVMEQAILDGDIVSYGKIEVVFKDKTVYVSVEVAQVDPINYVLVTSHFVPQEL